MRWTGAKQRADDERTDDASAAVVRSYNGCTYSYSYLGIYLIQLHTFTNYVKMPEASLKTVLIIGVTTLSLHRPMSKILPFSYISYQKLRLYGKRNDAIDFILYLCLTA